jgi:hydrogenase maturation protease
MNKKDFYLNKLLILGIGNLFMEVEGAGVHIAWHLQNRSHWKSADIVDGGMGGFHLMEFFQLCPLLFLVDATIDNAIPGTVKLLKQKFLGDYPPMLNLYDIVLRNLLDELFLLHNQPEVWSFTISVACWDFLSLVL